MHFRQLKTLTTVLVFCINLASLGVYGQSCHDWWSNPGYCDNADGCLDGELRADYSGNCIDEVLYHT